jgi:signal transduction histidine kinase
LDDLPALVDESRAAGMRISLDSTVSSGPVPAPLASTAYRIVREALTNAARHAPGAAVSVTVTGDRGDGVTVRVSNPPGPRPAPAAVVPSAGTGLVGLAERVALLGGRFEFGPAPTGEFQVQAWLPWPSPSGS